MTSEQAKNLLMDEWLPVQLQDNSVTKIRLSEIGCSDIIDIVSPRADFRGAIYQLLIGLLQTVFSPANRKEWQLYWNTPPDNTKLAAAFSSYTDAFNINTPVGTPAFMQDLTLSVNNLEPIEGLLFGGPGENTRKNNSDHFIKKGTIPTIDPYWAAITLFTFQINTAGGGSGHRVTLRGGGPVSTLLLPPQESETNTLWSKLWINTLTKERFQLIHGNHDLDSIEAIFPWMAETRTSEKDETTLPLDVNPMQMYWPMPARVRIDWIDKRASCGITGETANMHAAFVARKNKGINYTGNWVHPITPYEYSKSNEPISLKGRAAGEGYKNWTQLILECKTSKKNTEPASIVSEYYRSLQNWLKVYDEPIRLWVFGYDLKSAKAKCWYESTIPVYNLEPEKMEEVVYRSVLMIDAATNALDILKKALKNALFRDPEKDMNAKKFLGKAVDIDANFWSATEPDFYSILQKLVSGLDDEDRIDELLGRWREILKQEAKILFDQYALSNLNEDGDLKRVIKAREGKGGLQHYLNGSKALKALAA